VSPRTRTALLTGCFFLVGLFAPASMVRPRATDHGAPAPTARAEGAARNPRIEASLGLAKPGVELAVAQR
jgi:hypothetical protein